MKCISARPHRIPKLDSLAVFPSFPKLARPQLDSLTVEGVTGEQICREIYDMSRYAKRILIRLTAEQDAALRSRLVTLGVPVTEQIRRAVNLMLFADAKPRKKSSTKPSAEVQLFPEQKMNAAPMSVTEYEERKKRLTECVQQSCDQLLQAAREGDKGTIDLDAMQQITDGRVLLKLLEQERERRNG